MTGGVKSEESAHRRRRLSPAERRQQLIAVATELLNEHGIEKLQYTHLAAAAGVTRPVVYKFFPNKQALLVGIMEAFEAEMTQRFEATIQPGSDDKPLRQQERISRFMMAVCDTIEVQGAGAWHLLDMRGPNETLEAAGQAVQQRLLAPWRAELVRTASDRSAGEAELETLSRMMLATGRVTLNQWLNGRLSKEEAIHYTSLGISALLKGFATARRET